MTIKEVINKLLPMDKEKQISYDGVFTFSATDITVGYFLDAIINAIRHDHLSSEEPLVIEYGPMKLGVSRLHEDEDTVYVGLRRMEEC